MAIKNIVFLCLYSPGDKNVGYRRCLFFANAFARDGYRVHYITLNAPDYSGDFIEESICFHYVRQRDSIDQDIPSLFKTLKRFVLVKLIGQLPDPRLLLVRKILQKINLKLCPKETILIGSHPPWVAFLITYLLSKKFGFTYILDFRDLFYGSHLFSKRLAFIERSLQKFFVSRAVLSVTVSRPWCGEISDDCILVSNGFDGRKFTGNVTLNKTNIVRYFGSILHDDRVSDTLKDVILRNSSYNFEFYGNCELAFNILNGMENVKFYGFVPYEEAIGLMRSASFNLVLGASDIDVSRKGMLQTKIYEYMAARRPILYLGDRQSYQYRFLKKSNLVFDSLQPLSKGELQPNDEYINQWSRSYSYEYLKKNIENL